MQTRLHVGQVFGQLTVVAFVARKASHNYWLCYCTCGDKKTVQAGSLLRGATISCGCHGRAILGKSTLVHGMAGAPEHRVWKGMLQRCLNKNSKDYTLYGARGITVSEDWRVFENFYRDMGRRPEGTSLERTDNELGYSKTNCIWATNSVQANNKRTTVRVQSLDGESLSLTQWARKYGINYSTAYKYYKRGVDLTNHFKLNKHQPR